MDTLVQMQPGTTTDDQCLPEIGELAPLPDAGFDRIAGMAGRLLKLPLAFVTVFGASFQRFIGRSGSDMPGNTLEQSFCQYQMLGPDQELVVPDTLGDHRFTHLDCVRGKVPIRFYAGVPICSGDRVVGTVCVFDFEPHHDFGLTEIQTLRDLAQLALLEVDRHRAVNWARQAQRGRANADDRLQAMMRAIEDPVYVRGLDGTLTYMNPAAEALHVLGVLPDDPGVEAAAAESGTEGHYERVIWADDRARALWVRVMPDRGDGGQLRGTISLAREVQAPAAAGLSRRANDQIERRVLERTEVLARLAFTDALTGLGNRRAMETALERHLAQQPQEPLSLFLIDLNDFKAINDRYGHERGDEALRLLGQVLSGAFGESVYRLGGDEFVILQAQASAEQTTPGTAARPRPASLAGHREDLATLTNIIRELPRSVLLPGVATLSVSVGAASAPLEARSATDLLRLADERMLREKSRRHAGRQMQLLAGRSEPLYGAPVDLAWATLNATLSVLTSDEDFGEQVYSTLLSAGVAAIGAANAGSLYVQDSEGFVVLAQVGFTDRMLGLRDSVAESRAWYGLDLDWTLGRARVLKGDAIRERGKVASAFGSDGRKNEVYSLSSEPIRASLCVPIVSEGLMMGLLNLESFLHDDVFGPQEVRGAEEFALQLATIFTARSRARRERERQQEVERLLALSEALHDNLGLEGVAAVLAEQAGQLLRTGEVVYLPPDFQIGQRPVVAGLPQSSLSVLWPETMDLVREAVKTGRATQLNLPVVQANLPLIQATTSVLVAPVLSGGGGNLGALVVARELPSWFSARDSRVLMAMTGIAATAIDRAQAEQSLQERADEFRLLSELTSASMETGDPTQVALESLEMIAKFFGSSVGGYTDLTTGKLSMLGGRTVGLAPHAVARILRPTGEWTDGPMRGTGFTLDYLGQDRPAPHYVEAGLRTALLAEVHVAGSFRGVMLFGWTEVLQGLPRASAELLARAADLVSQVTERQEALAQLKDTREGALMALGLALELRDFETSGHTRRVVALAEQLGQRLQMPEEALENLRQGAYLHDVGKLAVPDSILLKPGGLDAQEWQTMKAHAEVGADLGQRIPALHRSVIDIIRHHHERWDGGGYPAGLKGEDIPLGARIFTLSDTFDALTSDRPYKKAWPRQAALDEIRNQSGHQFDPDLTREFLAMLDAQELGS